MSVKISRISQAHRFLAEMPPPPPPLTVQETAAARAALYVTALWGAAGHVPPIPVTSWRGYPYGTAIAELPDGTRLLHTPYTPERSPGQAELLRAPYTPDIPTTCLTAWITCPGGDRHQYDITCPEALHTARQDAAHCTTDHQDPANLDPEHPDYLDPADDIALPPASRPIATVRRLHALGA